MNDAPFLPAIHRVIDQVGTVILGKRSQVRLAIACLLARGHLLIEDVPGVGMFQYHAIYAARRELQWQPTAGESFHVFDMKWQN